jgi:transcriptional regulator with XRE-family HTH domain
VVTQNPLGEYLRARREQVRPEDLGVTTTSSRRVPGLRRDEVALLAGISTEYYTRLEQGRDRHPSEQVLDAVARVLGLDEAASAHLHSLAEHVVRLGVRKRHPAPRRVERVRPGVVKLVDSLSMPAWIEGRYLDILVSNRLAQAMSPLFTPGTNLLRSTVLLGLGSSDAPIARLVAQLRGSAGDDPDDPRLIELVGELSVRSETFAAVWARHEVTPPPGSGSNAFDHPQVGELTIDFEKLRVLGAEDQVLVICQPANAATGEALALLGSMTSDMPEAEIVESVGYPTVRGHTPI